MPSVSATILGAKGKLKQVAPNFVPRTAQLEMAETIEFTIEKNQMAVIEAGTGIGKTFAYLVPALLSGKKIIVSTGSKNLQDQLFTKDLPLLRKLFPIKRVSLLKGRANYLCMHRLEAQAPEFATQSKTAARDLAKISRWAKTTKTGDIAELTQIKESSGLWPYVTSTAENCLGTDCPLFKSCFVTKARQSALAADVVIINHYVFFADLALKEEGFGELLPNAKVIIFDEAHYLADIATNFFSNTISSRKLLILINDILTAYYELATQDIPELPKLLSTLKQTLKQMRLAFGSKNQRDSWDKVATLPALQRCLTNLLDQCNQITAYLQHLNQRSKELYQCYERCQILCQWLEQLVNNNNNNNQNKNNYLYWFETFNQSFVLYITPLKLQSQLASHFNQPDKSWIFTSATLAIGQDFNFFTQPLGLTPHCTKQLASPYDYKNNTLLYIPQGLPDIRQEHFIASLIKHALPIIQLSKGRCFLLFTSYQALHQARDCLKNTEFTLLVQGDDTKQQLLSRFRRTENAILLGTASFWQGVDVQGAALSCVVIDKLPFASPGDPIVSAKIAAIKEQGGNAFYDYQLPYAVIALKQGIGRLIRGEQDRGILIINDMRLIAKQYGKEFLRSLPDIPIARQASTALTKATKLLMEKHN